MVGAGVGIGGVEVGASRVSVGCLGVSVGGLGVLVFLLWVEIKVGLFVSVAVAVKVGVGVGLAQTHSGVGVGETVTQGFVVSWLGIGQVAGEDSVAVGSAFRIKLILMGSSQANVAPAKEATESTLAVFDNRSLFIE
ncbi:hypothetical protein A3E46_02690 [Candidatus Woesebacteria bacterium RIFCSPHIGHO2_12_FULL_46_16]|uniref:Uncharacterized protein n=1 Tax=Candidatus Woesebacteria bacterium RIFCSPHIGHO2_12_FULL_46_16 TaxID=1802513 RepID=A0A1F8B2F0_9BACT|nr:MAG: hypothetical protein A3E46_02690 [Candidatus Woesebacteria bacterium RIFCSPHIGHO2_12_FULL_46_16]